MTDRRSSSPTYELFSRRDKAAGRVVEPLTPEFRNRVISLCGRSFPQYNHFWDRVWGSKVDTRFWLRIHDSLVYLHGHSDLSSLIGISRGGDAITFLRECSVEHFFDFVELIFRSVPVRSSRDVSRMEAIVENINEFLRLDSLPYHLTEVSHSLSAARPQIGAFPQIIRREHETLHYLAIQPALALLTGRIFESANEEFLEALSDYRKGEYADCIAKCGSAFESVMKIICDEKQWQYQQADTVERLLNRILDSTSMGSFFKQPIMLIATIRNRLSSAHGAGVEPRKPEKHVAQYVINSTAAAILLLVEECKI